MKRNVVTGAAGAAILFVASYSYAKQYVDYTPEKGVWQYTAIEADPNHVDDYLTGLRASQTPRLEIMKKHGMIDDYRFVVRNGYVKGSPNVLIQVHFKSMAMLVPDKARDQMMDREEYAVFSEDAGKAAVAGYEKYRQFMNVGLWHEVTMTK